MSNSNQNAQNYHGAKLWQIGGFALNNTATNLWMFFMNFIAYYMVGFVGVGVVTASSFLTLMRIWDGVTDPFIGYLVDKTNTKFGKNRPFMVIGNLILLSFSFLMIHVSRQVPEGLRFPVFIVLYMVYIIGYTFQCVVTKSAQTCLTNNPKQRPIFTVFDGAYNTILFTFGAVFVSSFLVPKYGGFTEGFFYEAWTWTASISLTFTIIAIISISSKDNIKYFGLGKPIKIRFKDYWDVLKSNRAIQMLVISAGTDKLAFSAQGNSTVGVMIFGIVCGNYALNGAVAAYTGIPTFLFLLLGAGFIATRLGQKKAMLFGTYGALVCSIAGVLLFYLGDPKTMSLPGIEGFNGWNSFTVLFLLIWLGFKGFVSISGNIVIPMTADCADYETYRSGRYVPGLMGTLFSFVDKLISSLATTIIGLMCAAIGFVDKLPQIDTPYSDSIKFVAVFSMFGLIIIGLLCNVVAMKFYPLTKEKMASIQSEIAAIKAKGTEV
ncbi:glucuronide permease [Clostridiales bacterium COT073_COT-073]|nr:glucuronide permease [Clostridiales bacterium COT073_COT-073]